MRLLLFAVLFANIAHAALVSYDPTPGAIASETYRVTVDGQPVFVEKFKDVSYARFAMSGKVEVVVNIAHAVEDFVLSPVRLGIAPVRRGNDLVFTLDAPRRLIFQCKGLETLFLLADAPEENPPKLGQPGVVNVRDYVRDAIGTNLQRDQIQKALDAVAAQPHGGVLYFPAGTYLTGTLVIRSGVTVYLESGALLQGTADPHDYFSAASDPPRAAGTGKGTGALIYFVDAENAKLTGRGTIATQGTQIRRIISDHQRICNFIRCKNCELSDVVLRDAGGFNVHVLRSENIRLRGYKIINDLAVSNEDGTDPDSSRDVTVENVFMYTSDDAIAVKADAGLCEKIVIRDCVFWTKKSALKVGSDPYFGARDIVFENNDVVHADRALALYARIGFIENVRFLRNAAEIVGGDAKQQDIVFLISKVGPGGETSTGKKSPYTGYIKHVTVDGFYICRRSPMPSVIRGDGPRHAVTDVVFGNFYIGGCAVQSAADAGVEIGSDATGVTFSAGTVVPPDAAAMHLPDWIK